MAKNKRRTKKKTPTHNKHHILWERARWLYADDWVAKELAKYFVINLPLRKHDALHDSLSPIPRPSHKILLKIYQDFYPTKDILNDVEELIRLASKYHASKMAAALREELKFLKKK